MNKSLRSLASFIIAVMILSIGGYFVYGIYSKNNSPSFIEEITFLVTSPIRVSSTQEYKNANNRITELYNYNNGLKKSGEIYSYYGMPRNKASDLYIQSFLNRLIIQQEELSSVKNLLTDDTTEYVLLIEKIEQNVDTLEETFNNELDFNPVKIVLENGEEVIDSGVNGNRSKSLSKETAEKERIAIQTQMMGTTSVDEAEYLVELFDMEIVYGLNNMSQSCFNSYEDDDYHSVIALVCSADTSIIYVNVDHPLNTQDNNYVFLDYIKHEIAHKLIFERCGTMLPEIAGDDYESVTSSYAVKYLGADYLTLQSSGDTHSKYKMTDNSDNIAELIHDEGVCV